MKISRNKKCVESDAMIPAKPEVDEIVAADEIADSNYLDMLVTEVENILNSQGYDVTVDIEYDSVRVAFSEDSGGIEYLQPLEDIEPNEEDLREDADIIAQSAIDELHSAASTEEVGDDVEPIMSEEDLYIGRQYEDTLIDKIRKGIFKLFGQKELTGVVVEKDKDNLYITVTTPDSGESVVKEYTVPWSDLSLEDDSVDDDVAYIVNTVKDDFQEITSSTKIQASEEVWTEIAHKMVEDSDGSMTDYTLYENKSGTLFIAMFGDTDLYEPDPMYADFESDDYDEAIEWFNCYNGFAEDYDDDYYDDDYHERFSEEEDEFDVTGCDVVGCDLADDPDDANYAIGSSCEGEKVESAEGSKKHQPIFVAGKTLDEFIDKFERITGWKVDRENLETDDFNEFWITAYSYLTGDEVEYEIKVTPTQKNGKVIDYITFFDTDIKQV